MPFDPENKIIKLCVQGMQSENTGDKAGAHRLFQQAWQLAENNFEAFTAAHYLARNQENPEDSLKWNLEALKRAESIADEAMKTYYPSLYLNVGRSYENTGNIKAATHYYQLASDKSSQTGTGPYDQMIKSGIAEGLRRVKAANFHHPGIDRLITAWCERKDLKPLSFILPAWVGNTGNEQDKNKLVSALSYLAATRCLNEEELNLVYGFVEELSRPDS